MPIRSTDVQGAAVGVDRLRTDLDRRDGRGPAQRLEAQDRGLGLTRARRGSYSYGNSPRRAVSIDRVQKRSVIRQHHGRTGVLTARRKHGQGNRKFLLRRDLLWSVERQSERLGAR